MPQLFDKLFKIYTRSRLILRKIDGEGGEAYLILIFAIETRGKISLGLAKFKLVGIIHNTQYTLLAFGLFLS